MTRGPNKGLPRRPKAADENDLRSTSHEKDSTVITVISKPQLQDPAKEACLVVINGLDLGRKHGLDQSSVLIGRSSKTDIQIDQDSISRNHAMLLNDGTRYLVRDLGSTNGTYVNDHQINEHTLIDGDQIRVGRTIFKFLMGSNIESSYHEEIYRLTTQDSLTQVYNKRYFLENLEREMSRSLRYNRRMALSIFDIDFFKKINDTHGHLTGDFVLKQLATRVHKHIRRDDILARYGGEEFIVLLPELDKERAVTMSEKIRRLVASEPFSFDNKTMSLTISVGVADLEEYITRLGKDAADRERADPNPMGLIKLADDRLLEAKRLGRDQVVSG